MCGGRFFTSWRGPGDTYDWPAASGRSIISANQANRWLPYRNENLQREIMVSSGQNQSGQSWEQFHSGVKSAAVSENLRRS